MGDLNMEYCLYVEIIRDGDFGFESKWEMFGEDYRNSYWMFNTRQEAIKALNELYDDIIATFRGKEWERENILNRLKFFKSEGYLQLVERKFDTFKLENNTGNQEIYISVEVYDSDKKECDYCMSFSICDIEHYNWGKIKKLDDVK